MKNSNVLVNGLTSSGKVSKNLRNIVYSKVDETNVLKLSYIPYEISKILNIDIGISIKIVKKIKLGKGCKLNIIGFKNINLKYISPNSNKKVYKLKYKIPFSTELSYDYSNFKVKKIYVPVDKCDLKMLDPKQLSVTTRLYIAPLI